MKKVWSLVFFAVMSLSLWACGETDSDEAVHTMEHGWPQDNVLVDSEENDEIESEEETVAVSADVGIPENAIPDILSWGGDAVEKHRSTLYEIYITDEGVINDYVALLQECGFTLSEHWKSPSDNREEWGFVKEEYPDWQKYGAQWLDNSYHLSFYHMNDNSREYWFVYDNETFVLHDFGIRRDGSEASPGPVVTVPEETESTTDLTLVLEVGETAGVSYTWTQFGSAYNTYDWEVTSGSDHIEIQSVTGDTCKIKALSEGTAILQVKYHYTKDSEDVLTGKPRKQLKVKTKEYKIVVE